MKTFLTKITLLFLPIVTIVVVSFFVESAIFKESLRYPDCTIGLIGDSHPQCAVNEALIPGLANFAQRTSQPMVWKAKLGQILKANPQLTTFIIELWPDVYLKSPMDPAEKRARFTRGFFPSTILLDLLEAEDMGGVPASGFGRSFIDGIIYPFVKRCFSFSNKHQLQEGFFGLDNIMPQEKRNDHNSQAQELSVPQIQLTVVRQEIESIIEECQANGLKVVILTTPLLKNWCDAVSEDVWAYFNAEMRDLSQKYGLVWLDYSMWPIEDNEWADPGHLNVTGANRFSEHLRSKLEVLSLR